ncbi:MAG: metalloregulator ArsR/SmtB family transcription factor [Ilumatobacteraceae bacterium]|jgi:rhodanese-related sulfurtransferase|nr:metalloregulator ArsR/SmtB family transcription factor [Ilumatobacteraceae bacterium]
MGDRQAKDALYDAFGEVAKALASGRRAELVDVLAQGERHVEELADEIGQSVANTSFHLRALATAGLVTTRREGTRIYYRLASDRVAELWAALRDVAAAHHEHLDDLAAAYLGDRSRLEQVGREELAERIRSGDVVVVDVRPAAEFVAGHIAGARSIPVDELAANLRSLPADVEVVAYCRGPYCVFADDAVRLLRRRGRRARRLVDGFPEWRRAALPVEAGVPSPP